MKFSPFTWSATDSHGNTGTATQIVCGNLPPQLQHPKALNGKTRGNGEA